jgi:hypothetical protein
MTDPASAAPRRGWWWLGLAVIAFLLVGDFPLLYTLLPVHQPVLMALPLFAVCALIGWRKGGSAGLAVATTAMAGVRLWIALRAGSSTDLLLVQWSVITAVCLGVTLLVLRPHHAQHMLAPGVITVVAAGVVAGVLVAVSPAGPSQFQRAVDAATAERGKGDLSNWQIFRQQMELAGRTTQDSVTTQLFKDFERTVKALPATAKTVFPSLLALQSLLAIALVWALFHRFSRTRLGDDLARLRDFRFNDHWIWTIIAGLVLVLVPALGSLQVLGINLLVFFGALYVLRGTAVVAWFLRPGRGLLGLLIGLMMFLLLRDELPIVLGLVGLSDTWADWRRRITPAVS